LRLGGLERITAYLSIRQIGFIASSQALTYATYGKALEAKQALDKQHLQLDTSKNQGFKGKVGLFIISGIPGSGKSELASSFLKSAGSPVQWAVLNTPLPPHPHPKDHNLEAFKKQLLEFIAANPFTSNIIIVLRGYHLVSGYLRVLTTDKELTVTVVVRGVMTKVRSDIIKRLTRCMH
jgi:hypothetical protein